MRHTFTSPGQIGRRFRKYPDTKTAVWASAGCRGQRLRQVYKKNEATLKLFYEGSRWYEYEKNPTWKGKFAAGTVPFYKTHRLHGFQSQCQFPARCKRNDWRQNLAPHEKWCANRKGGWIVKMNMIREWREIAIPHVPQTNSQNNMRISDKGLQKQSLCGTIKLPQADWPPERGSLWTTSGNRSATRVLQRNMIFCIAGFPATMD